MIVRDTREAVDHGFRNVADDGEAAAHIAIESAIADGDFAFVAGGEDERSEFVGECHERDAAQAGLEVLLGSVERSR